MADSAFDLVSKLAERHDALDAPPEDLRNWGPTRAALCEVRDRFEMLMTNDRAAEFARLGFDVRLSPYLISLLRLEGLL